MILLARRSLTPKRSCSWLTQIRLWAAVRTFCDHLLQHRLVQAQVGHQLLELAILFFQLTQPLELRWPKTAVLLLPVIKSSFGNPHLPADLGHRCPELGLLQRIRNLLFGKTRLLHGMTPHPARGPSCRILYLSVAQFSGSGSLGYSLANLNQANERIADINSIDSGEHPIVFEVSNATWVDNSHSYNVLQPPLIISKKDEIFSRFLQGRHTRYDLETLLTMFDLRIGGVRGRTDPLVRALVAHSECVLMINRLVVTSLLYAAAVKGVAEPCFPRTFRGVSHHLERELPTLVFRPFPRALHAARVILSGSTLEEVNEHWVSARREHPRIEADLAGVDTRIRLALERFRDGHQESSSMAPSKTERTGMLSGCDPDLASTGIWHASEQRFIPIHLGDGEDELHCLGLKVEHEDLGFSF